MIGALDIGDVRRRYRVGSHCTQATLTEQQVIEIRSRYAAGAASQSSLAAEYGIHQNSVSRIVRRASWRHVP